MLTLRLAFCSLLLGAPFVSLGQTAAPVASPRFYAGLGLYNSEYHSFQFEPNDYRSVPVQLTLGYQWRPRLAVQASLAYSANHQDYSGSLFDAKTKQYYNPYAGTYSRRSTSTALLARYTLTGQLAHRVQFDVLGGGTLERTAYQSSGFRTDSIQRTTQRTDYDDHSSYNTLLVTLGASVRCRLVQHLELTLDLAANHDVRTSRQYPFNGITSSAALGLRYRFGSR